MEIYIYTKKYFKDSPEIKKGIIKSIHKLHKRILLYQDNGIKFNNIYNDDVVKHDIHGKFCTFKDKQNGNQLRILYAYIEETNTFIIMDYIIKKENGNIYLTEFDIWNDRDPKNYLVQSKKVS